MSDDFEINWNPNLERDLTKQIQENATPQFAEALARVACPEHNLSPTIEVDGDGWQLKACCEAAKQSALEAISQELE